MKKIIVVTGASSGMGKEFVLQISRKVTVDEIWVIARSEDKLRALQSEVETKIVPIALDLSDIASIKTYADKLAEEKPNIRILANCAGFGKFDHTENLDADTLTNMVELNCTAAVAMISYSLPYIGRKGRILNIASCAGFQPIPYINCYAASKAFLLNYSRALNQELKYKQIHVLAVTPFWTKTAFFDRAIDPSRKEVVISYAAMYDPAKVMKKAIRDLFSNKDVSCYGLVNNVQRILVRILPKSIVMKVWMASQKLDGTPGIR